MDGTGVKTDLKSQFTNRFTISNHQLVATVQYENKKFNGMFLSL